MDFFHSDAFQNYVRKLLKQHDVPGLSIGIIHHDQEATAGFGCATRFPERPCTPDTLFEIASCSKSLTAACIALLVEDEAHSEIRYDAIMHNLLPDFVMSQQEHTVLVTLDDVLGHHTGMAPHDDSVGLRDTAKDITRNLRKLAVAAPPRSHYLYSNMMYTVLTHLIESRTGQIFAEFVQERVFAPLGMDSTCIHASNANSHRMAAGYIWSDGDFRLHELRSQDAVSDIGASCVISSVKDFLKYIRALIHHEDPIDDDVYAGLTKMRSIINPNPHAKKVKRFESAAFYAAGLDIWWYRGHMIGGHTGTIPGLASRFLFIPDKKFGLVIFGNATGAYGVCTILAQMLIDEILEVPEHERRHKRPTSKPRKSKTKKAGIPNDVGLTPQVERFTDLQLKTPSPLKTKRKQRAGSVDSQGNVIQVPDSQPSSPVSPSRSPKERGPRGQNSQGQLILVPRRRSLPPVDRVADSFSSYDQPVDPNIEYYRNDGYGLLQLNNKGQEKEIKLVDCSQPFVIKLEENAVEIAPVGEGEELLNLFVKVETTRGRVLDLYPFSDLKKGQFDTLPGGQGEKIEVQLQTRRREPGRYLSIDVKLEPTTQFIRFERCGASEQPGLDG